MFGAAVVAQSFVPSDLSGLYQWFDAADSGSITETSSRVSQWNDKSGNNYHGVQATAVNQPVKGTSSDNGLPSIFFDGPTGNTNLFDQHLPTSAPLWNQFEMTMFVVCNKSPHVLRGFPFGGNYFRLKSSESGYGIMFAGDGTDSHFGDKTDEVYGVGGAVFHGYTGTIGPIADGVDVLVQQQNKFTESGDNTDFIFAQKNNNAPVYQTQGNGPTHISTTFTDGADSTQKDSWSTIGGKWFIGSGFSSFTNNSSNNNANDIGHFAGHIQEIITYNRLLSDGERNQVMGHLMGKWRLA